MIYLILALTFLAGLSLGFYVMYCLIQLAGRIGGAIEERCKGAIPFR